MLHWNDIKGAAKKASKYGNTTTTSEHGKFDSAWEEKRYAELRMLERGRVISNLKRQVVFVLAPSVRLAGKAKATPALRYVADFVYEEKGRTIVEDAKGAVTDIYRIKRHLMKSVHNIDIVESRIK